MKEYIKNLTDYLIAKNRYEVIAREYHKPHFLRHVIIDLLLRDVQQMKPEKLGTIIGSFEFGDVQADRNFLSEIGYSGNPSEVLRGMVSTCLAIVIWDRLNSEAASSNLPPYKSSKNKSPAGRAI